MTGVDFTPEMLDIARRKNRSSLVSFEEGDAHDLSAFGAGRFDLCSCAFGFRNFSDRRKVLEEIRRVLAPGGELLVLEFFRPRSAALGFLVSAWVRLAAALFARGRGAAYRHLRDSIRRMDDVDDFAALAEDCGFSPAARRFLPPSCTCLRFAVRAASGMEDGTGERHGQSGF